MISRVTDAPDDEAGLAEVHKEAEMRMKKFPLYPEGALED